MLCSEAMREDPPFLFEDDVVQTAAKKMRDFGVSYLPVCDFSHRVTGSVTEHDLVLRVCADDLPSSTRRIHEVMSEEVAACRPEDDSERAVALMNEHKRRWLTVTDSAGLLRGVLSLDELRRGSVQKRPVGTIRESAARRAVEHES